MSGAHHGAHAVAGPEGTKAGLRAIRISAVVLGLAAVAQLTVVALSHSAGLLAAGLDNLGDGISTVALALAFLAARRAADRRYTFGYQRLEDLAGVVIVMVIWASAALAGYGSVRKLLSHGRLESLPAGIAVALVGAAANEVVSLYKTRVGRRISSEPLIADGQHARADALASIAAFGGLLGARAGWRVADPIAGLAITVAIAYIAFDATRHVLARLLDAVDPSVIEAIEHIVRDTEGVRSCGRVQARWAGRSLYVTLTIATDGALSVRDAHEVAEAVHHQVIHEFPEVAQVDVHVDPEQPHADDAHERTAHHPPVEPEDRGHHHA